MNLNRPISILAGIVAVFIVSFGGATSLGNKAYDSALMAGWLQAIGSVAAIVGALWIAFRQDRIKHASKLDAAHITAIGMIERVRENADELVDIVNELKSAARYDCDPNYFPLLESNLSALRKWSVEEELKVIPLGRQCAAKLALSRDRLHVSKQDVSAFNFKGDRFDSEKRKQFSKKLVDQLADVPTMLQHVADVCKQSTEKL